MFFNFNQLIDIGVSDQEFDLDQEIDSLALAIKIRTLVVPLGQSCPAILQNFLDKEEKYRVKLKAIFIYRHKKNGWIEARTWLLKFFSHRWQLVSQF